MTPAVVLTCAGCHARVKAPLQLLGQTRPCPGCETPLVVRVAAPDDAGPVLVEQPEPRNALAG